MAQFISFFVGAATILWIVTGAFAQSTNPTPAISTTRPANSPIADGAVPIKLAGGFSFTEGSTSDADGNIYFVDQPNNRIMKWVFANDPNDPLAGHLETFLQPSGYSNGLSFDNDGNLVACADEKNELWLISSPFPKRSPATTQPFTPADLKITVLAHEYEGKPLNAPNDVWIIPKGPLAGGLFFTDPLYARSWWTNRPGGRGMQQPGKYVYYLSADRKTLKPVITDLRTPNGIIGTPDGKTLYMADIGANQTFSYAINDDGTVTDKKPFCPAGSDGMTIDSAGNVYTTLGNQRGGVQIWNKDGNKIDSIPIGSANCCFGGKDGDILFICAGKEVYGIRMKTRRVGPQ